VSPPLVGPEQPREKRKAKPGGTGRRNGGGGTRENQLMFFYCKFSSYYFTEERKRKRRKREREEERKTDIDESSSPVDHPLRGRIKRRRRGKKTPILNSCISTREGGRRKTGGER